MADRLKFERPDPHSLIVRKNRAGGLLNLAGFLFFFIVWYGFLIGPLWTKGGLFSLEAWQAALQSLTRQAPFLWLFILAPLFSLPQMLAALKISLWGEAFVFDGLAQVILKDNQPAAQFADVRAVEIRAFADEGGNDYRVSVLLHSGQALHVTTSNNDEQMASLAADIARILNTGVVKA